MKKGDWLSKQFETLSKGRDDYWPEGTKGLKELFSKYSEKVTRKVFWEAFHQCYKEDLANNGQPSDDCLEAWEYFANTADFSVAWETSPLTEFVEAPKQTLIDSLKTEAFLQIGGVPNWIQSSDTPICEYCDRDMALVLQLDSVSKELGEAYPELAEISFGDAGRVYLFCCKGHGTFDVRYQCY